MIPSEFQVLPKLISTFLFIAIHIPFSAHAQMLACDGFGEDFEGPLTWTVNDAQGTGITWGRLADCGETGNYTGGTGDALCMAPIQDPSTEFDATITSNSFSLKDATSAVLNFKLNYQDVFNTWGDRLRLQIQVGGTGPWTDLVPYDSSQGGYQTTGTSQIVFLNAYLGNDDLRLRWQYDDPGSAPDAGYYAQIDDMILNCTGGADVSAEITPSKTLVLEGESVNFQATIKNNGPAAATQPVVMFEVPQGFHLFSATASQGIVAVSNDSVALQLLTLPNGGEVTLDVKSEAGLEPRAVVTVNAPAGIAGDYEAAGAMFGPQLEQNKPITGNVVLADDGAGTKADACQTLTNSASIQGNIALIKRGGCDYDDKMKHAIEAGAIAVVIDNFMELMNEVRALRASKPMPNVLTIPAFAISDALWNSMKNALVTITVNVTVNAKVFLSQEQKSFVGGVASVMDPDMAKVFAFLYKVMFGLFLGPITANDLPNNYAINTVTVLKDSDKDGIADLNEDCPNDPAKTAKGICGCGVPDQDKDGDGALDCNDACPDDKDKTSPGVCGCGVADSDNNNNGITDCLASEELKNRLEVIRSTLRKVKPPKNKKQRKRLKLRKQELNALIAEMQALVASAGGSIQTTKAVDLAKKSRQITKNVKRALKVKNPYFSRYKKQARRKVLRLLKLLV